MSPQRPQGKRHSMDWENKAYICEWTQNPQDWTMLFIFCLDQFGVCLSPSMDSRGICLLHLSLLSLSLHFLFYSPWWPGPVPDASTFLGESPPSSWVTFFPLITDFTLCFASSLDLSLDTHLHHCTSWNNNALSSLLWAKLPLDSVTKHSLIKICKATIRSQFLPMSFLLMVSLLDACITPSILFQILPSFL